MPNLTRTIKINGIDHNLRREAVIGISKEEFENINSLYDALEFLDRKKELRIGIDRVDRIEYDTVNGVILITDRGVDLPGEGVIDHPIALAVEK